jgi:hypothetical protein
MDELERTMDMGKCDGLMTRQRALELSKRLLEYGSSSAIQCFDEAAMPVRRVEMKVNPAKHGEFLLLAILADGRCYEGRSRAERQDIEWCKTPNCTCMEFARTRSPIHFGASIDD